MARFIIEGSRPLRGTVRPSGNKNEVLPAMMACLLTDKPVILRRVPRILDLICTCDILEELGVKVDWPDHETVVLDAASVTKWKPSQQLCSKIRASILLMGPLLSRFGKIELPLPGGDVIGARRIDTHWEGAEALGAKLEWGQSITGTATKLKGTELFLDEPSVTATENLLLLSVRAEGVTILNNAACEPHVSGLCRLLVRMGAKIFGIGTNRLQIHGVPQLHGAEHEIGPDFMEMGSYLCLGAIGGGRITIQETDYSCMRFVFKTLERLGIRIEETPDGFTVDGANDMQMRQDVGGRIPSIYSGPWPAYPTDLMSVAIVAATQAQGSMIFFEKMFDGRMFFTDKLVDMGARLVLCDPHRVVVTGKFQLYGARMSSPDIRAGMALLTAALVAKGRSEIDNIAQIDRGFADIDRKLESLGAAITRTE